MTVPPWLTVAIPGRKLKAPPPGKLKVVGLNWATSLMLMVGWVLAALTGVANSRVASMLIAGRIFTSCNIVLGLGPARWLIRPGRRKQDFSVSGYNLEVRFAHVSCKIRYPRLRLLVQGQILVSELSWTEVIHYNPIP